METKIKDKWLERVKETKRKNTYDQYVSTINKAYSYFEKKLNPIDEMDMLKKIDIFLIEEYVNILKENNMLATVNMYLATIRVFFKYVVVRNREYIPYNPCEGLEQFEVLESDKKEKIVPNITEIRKLLLSCDVRKKNDKDFEFLSIRNKSLIAILSMNGNRIKELLEANMSDIERIEQGYAVKVRVGNTKNKINKRILIVGSSANYFRDYLFERANHVKRKESEEQKIFISARCKGIETNHVNRMLRLACEKSDIRRITSCCFRNYASSTHVEMETNKTLANISVGWRSGMYEQYSTKGDLLSRYDTQISNIIQNFI